MNKEEYLYITKKENIHWAINLREYPIEVYFKKSHLWEEDFDLEYFHIGTKDGTGFTIDQFNELYNIYVIAQKKQKDY